MGHSSIFTAFQALQSPMHGMKAVMLAAMADWLAAATAVLLTTMGLVKGQAINVGPETAIAVILSLGLGLGLLLVLYISPPPLLLAVSVSMGMMLGLLLSFLYYTNKRNKAEAGQMVSADEHGKLGDSGPIIMGCLCAGACTGVDRCPCMHVT